VVVQPSPWRLKPPSLVEVQLGGTPEGVP